MPSPTPSPSRDPADTTTATPTETINTVIITPSPTKNPTVNSGEGQVGSTTTDIPSDCNLRYNIKANVNSTEIKLGDMQGSVDNKFQALFLNTIIDQLSESIDAYSWNQVDVTGTKDDDHYVYKFVMILCIASDSNSLYENVLNDLNDTSFWSENVENSLNENDDWTDDNSKVRLQRVIGINSNPIIITDNNLSPGMLALLIIISVLLVMCIGLIVYWYFARKKQQEQLNEALIMASNKSESNKGSMGPKDNLPLIQNENDQDINAPPAMELNAASNERKTPVLPARKDNRNIDDAEIIVGPSTAGMMDIMVESPSDADDNKAKAGDDEYALPVTTKGPNEE